MSMVAFNPSFPDKEVVLLMCICLIPESCTLCSTAPFDQSRLVVEDDGYVLSPGTFYYQDVLCLRTNSVAHNGGLQGSISYFQIAQ